MTIRWYLLPMEQNAAGTAHGPRYFEWRFDPDPPGLTSPKSYIDYGLIDQCMLVSDITSADHTSLTSHADVLSIPINLDNKLTATAVTAAHDYLEGIGTPAEWVSTTYTYRQVLRVVAGCFLYLQRVTALLGRSITLTGGTLDLQVQNIPTDIRAAMAQAANEMGYDYSTVTGTTTVRQILKAMAQAWGTTAINFGLATL
jgi:hypothetical protein